MAIARKLPTRPTKKERIKAHIEELERAIIERFPEARFEVAPVPDSRWPGLWVRTTADCVSDVTDMLAEIREEFFLRENMDVHVIVLDLEEDA